jgi:aspartate-semialdehyde dehydrogenase
LSLLGKKVGIVGATGVVGQEILAIFEELGIKPAELKLFASARSEGMTLPFNEAEIEIFEAKPENLKGLDLIFFATTSELTGQLVPEAVKNGAVVIDNSSVYRQDPNVPLVVPEINAAALKDHQGIIANPNCSTIIMLLPLAVLHEKWTIKKIIVSTYQAASGAGAKAMQELSEQTRSMMVNEKFEPEVFKYQIAFNLFSHDSDIGDNGYCEEENKMIIETHKILGDDSIKISPTTIRVPILRAHSESINVTFEKEPNVKEARAALEAAEGMGVIDDQANNRFPMPIDVSGKNDVQVGRIRLDLTGDKGLNLFVVGDQIRKGAALNAIQIAQRL